MGLNLQTVSATAVASSRAQRLDVRFHALTRRSAPQFEAIGDFIPLRNVVRRVMNGVNLPAAAYADEASDSSGFRYVSVGALSSGVLQSELSVPLRATYDESVRNLCVRDDELLVTRSGTPGIAWSPQSQTIVNSLLVPSGFMIRLQLNTQLVDPTFVSAIINHPSWQLQLRAMSAGKSQDNLGQEDLLDLPIPVRPMASQLAVAEAYRRSVLRIRSLLHDGETLFARSCDRVLENHGFEPHFSERPRWGKVALSAVAGSRVSRMDYRFHSRRLEYPEYLGLEPQTPLRTFLSGSLRKGRQPEVGDDLDPAAYTVAVASIQEGTIVPEQLKATTVTGASRFEVSPGQLLVTVDGEGAIGKAAVMPEVDRPTTVDSHVAIANSVDADAPWALACFLNSTVGKALTDGITSGATGQTQIATTDLEQVGVPESVYYNREAIASEYQLTLRSFVPMRQRVEAIATSAGAETLALIGIADVLSGPV